MDHVFQATESHKTYPQRCATCGYAISRKLLPHSKHVLCGELPWQNYYHRELGLATRSQLRNALLKPTGVPVAYSYHPTNGVIVEWFLRYQVTTHSEKFPSAQARKNLESARKYAPSPERP